MTLQPQSKEEKLCDLFQIMQSNIFLLAEIKDVLERTADAAVIILNDKRKENGHEERRKKERGGING